MHIIPGRAALARQTSAAPVGAALAIGNFDGVHRGHQALLASAVAEAAGVGGAAGVLTFDPHPARYFAGASAPPLLSTLERRLALIAEAGIAFAVVEPFERALAEMDADRFIDEVLVETLRVGHVVVGYDFSFGRGRAGNGSLLQARGAQRGFGVTVVPPVDVDGVVCSSTRIRRLIMEGQVEAARPLLGRPVEIAGVVVRGAGRGRGLGIPTANLEPDGALLPKTGIYAAWAQRLDKPGGPWPAALSIGTNPTFGAGGPVTVEAHLLDFDADLYGATLRLQVVTRLRDERWFPSVDELLRQIDDDIARARAMLVAA